MTVYHIHINIPNDILPLQLKFGNSQCTYLSKHQQSDLVVRNRLERFHVPDFDRAVKTASGQYVGIIWMKLAVEDSLNMTLAQTVKDTTRNILSHILWFLFCRHIFSSH